MSVTTGPSDLQFSTKEDLFWASVSFDQLEDEEFILDQYHKLQQIAEVGSNEENEARLKDVFESDNDALLAEMGLKKDLALPLEVISSGIKPTVFDVQIKRRTKIVERICVALSRVHESSSTKPKIIEFQRRENTISLQKLISGKINNEAIKAFLTHVDTNGIFSLLHHKQQPLNRLQEKFIELVDNKQEPKDRYSRMQAITGLIALAVSRASLKDMIASIKSILVEQNRAEDEMQSSSISPSVVAMHYLTKLVKYRKYKELSAMTSEDEAWNIEVRAGVVLGMCSDGKYLFVAYKDASSISIVKYGTGLYGTERAKQYSTVTLRSRTVSSNSRVWLAVVGKKLYLMIQNNASLITVVDTKDMREDASINLNHVKKDDAHIVLKRSTSGLNNNNNNQMQVDSPNTADTTVNTTATNVPPPPPPPPQTTTPVTPVQPQPTITCSPFTSDGRFLYQLSMVAESDLERGQAMSDSQESKGSKTDSAKLVCLDVYDPYRDMTLLSRVALTPPGNPVRQSERVCEGCGRVNMDLRAYQCKSCYNYVLCSACYTSGYSSKTHNASHVMDPIKESLSVDNTTQKLPFTNDALTRGTLYVTGHQLAIVIPPKVLPNTLKDRYLCRLFNIEDGSFIADVQTGIGELAGVFACYDTANDMLWSLATSNNIHRVTNWHNLGLGNQHFSALQPVSQITLESVSAEALLSQPDYTLSNIYDEKAQISLERACYILLYHVDLFTRRLNEKNATHRTQKSAEYAVSMREHFCMQASKEVFVQLNALLALCTELYRTKTTPLFKYALLVTLRTMRLNIDHVLMSKIELAEFGLEGALARNIKDKLLELLAIPLHSDLDQSAWQQVQAESAQLLLTGLNMFYCTHEDKALLLLSLLQGEFQCSARTELLDTLLDVLITHEETFAVLNYKSGGREVFKQLLEHSAQDTAQQLSALEELVRDKEHTHRLFSVESKSSRVNSLLFYYQNLLIGRAMNDKRHEPLVLLYLTELLRCSGTLLTRVSEQFQRAEQEVSVESVEYSQYTDLLYHRAFKHSLLGTLLSNGLLGLRALQLRGILTITDETTHTLLAPCAQLAAVLDKFNSQVPRVLLEERNRLYKRHTLNLYKAKYVESTHPYLEYANKEVLVNIPKSIHMKVEFDDKCSTENCYDYLQLCVRRPDTPNVLEPISEQFWGHGKDAHWPKGHVTVPGHTVIFLFHTEGGWTTNMMRNMVAEEQSEALVARRYGFRCKVKGLVKTKPFFIINSLYLHKTLAWFVTANLADMMRAPYLTASEQTLSTLLDSSVVFEHIDVQEMVDSEHATFLRDLVTLQGHARVLHDTMLSALRGQVLPLPADCQAVVDPALRAVLAVLLKYSGAMLGSAVSVSQQLTQHAAPDSAALNALKALWRYIYVQQMRPWLTTTAQHMKQRADKSGAAMTILDAYSHLSAQLTALAEVLLHVTAPSSVTHEELWSEVLRVFRQLPVASTLTSLVHKRRHAAQLRARALRDMRALFMNTTLISVKQDVLSFFTPVFKQLGGHYTAGLKGCGDQHMQQLRECFEQLFTPLLHSLRDNSNNYYRLLALDLFVQHYRAEDLPLLHSTHFFEHLLQACERPVSTGSTEEVHLKTKALHLDAAPLPNSFTSKYGKVCQQLIGNTVDLESALKGQSVEYQLSEQYSPEYALIMWLYPHSYAEVQNTAGNTRCVLYKPTSEHEGIISVQLNSSFYVTFTAATATGVKILKSVQPLNLAEWNHVQCVCMPHRLVLYINGVLDNELLLADADTPVFTAQPFTLNTMPTGTHSDADPSLACHVTQAHLVLTALYDEDADLLARQPPLPPDVAQKEREDAKRFRATARALLWSLGTQQHAPAAAQSALATLLRRRLDAPLRPSKLRVLAAMVRGYAETVHSDAALPELVNMTVQLMSRPLPPRLYRTALALAARILTAPHYDHSAPQSPFITPTALINRLGVALRITMAIGPRLAAQSPLSFEAPTTQAVLVLHYWAGLEPENFAALLQKHATKIYPSKPGVYSPLSRLGEVARETQELGKSVLRMGTLDECWSLGAYLSRFGFTLSIELHPSNPSLHAQLSIKERMQSAHKSEVISKLDQFCRPGLGADSMYGHAGALVHLVRGMMRVSAAQSVISEFLMSAVALIPRLMQLDEIKLDDAMTQSIVDGVLSSLAIIGGWNELHLRPGALVDVTLEGCKKRAMLVRYQRIGNQAAVVFMNELDSHVITTVDTSQCEPVPLVSPFKVQYYCPSYLTPRTQEPFDSSTCPLDVTTLTALCHLLLPTQQLPLAKKHPLLTLQLKSMALRALHTLLEYEPNRQLYLAALAQNHVPSVLELARHSSAVRDSARVLQQNKLIMLRLHEINHASEGTLGTEHTPAPRVTLPHQPYLTAEVLRAPTGFATARNTHHVVLLDNMHRRVAFFGNEKDGAMIPVNAPIPENVREFYFEISFKHFTPPAEQPATDQDTSTARLDALLSGSNAETTPDLALGVCGTFGHLSWANPHCYAYHSNGTKSHMPVSDKPSANEEEERRYICPYCHAEGFTEPELVMHVPLRHPNANKSVVCPICASSPFGDPTQLSADFPNHLLERHRGGAQNIKHYNPSVFEPYASSFTPSDVVGCGYNRDESTVYFTLNGKYMGAAFVNVNEVMLPFIALKSSHVVVSINLGHEPFAFKVSDEQERAARKKIDEERVMELLRAEKERVARQKADALAKVAARRELAMTLSGFVGFPIPFCMKALEEQEDNIERAADWALLNMEQYQLNHPELFVDDVSFDELMSDEDAMSDVTSELSATAVKSSESSLTDSQPLSNVSKSALVTGWRSYTPQHSWQSDQYSAEMQRVDRAHEQHWSDKTRPAVVTIDEVHVGCYYKVAEVSEAYREALPLWLKTMDRTMGKIGVARSVDKHRLLVRLKFYNEDDMTTSSYWYPVSILDPVHNWRQDNQPNDYSSLHIEAIDDVVLLEEIAVQSERDVTAVLLHQLATHLVQHVTDVRTLLPAQSDVMSALLPLLDDWPAAPLDPASPVLTHLTRAVVAHVTSPQSLAQLLTVACKKLASGAQFSLQQTVTHESDHPFNYHKYVLAREPAHYIHVPGAHQLHIHFDARTKLSQYDVLSLYSDPQSTHLIARFNQRVGTGRQITHSAFTPLVVDDARCWVQYTREFGVRPPFVQQRASVWGWKMTCIPSHIDLHTAFTLLHAITQHTAQWGGTESCAAVLMQLFEILLKFVTEAHVPQPFLVQAIRLLTRVLTLLVPHKELVKQLCASEAVKVYAPQVEEMLQLCLQDLPHNNQQEALVTCSLLVQNLFELCAQMTHVQRSVSDKLNDKMQTEEDEEDQNKRPRKRSKSNAVEWWKWAFDRCVDSVDLMDYFIDRTRPLPSSALYNVWLDSQSFNFTMTAQEMESRKLFLDNGEITDQFEEILKAIFTQFDADHDDMWSESEFETFILRTADASNSPKKNMDEKTPMNYLNFKKFIGREYSTNKALTWRRLVKLGYLGCLHKHNTRFEDFEETVRVQQKWSAKMDEVLVHYLDDMHDKGRDWKSQLCGSKELMVLCGTDPTGFTTLIVRVTLLEKLNQMVSAFLPFVDMSAHSEVSSLAQRVCALRNMLLQHHKMHFFDKVLSKTVCPSRDPSTFGAALLTENIYPTVYIDRLDVAKYDKPIVPKAEDDSDEAVTRVMLTGQELVKQWPGDALFNTNFMNFITCNHSTIFLQAMTQLYNSPPLLMRQAERCFKVVFKRESAEGEVGPYRESLSQLSQELQSDKLPLLIRSPNMRLAEDQIGVGESRDKWIPNPAATSPACLAMCRFFGVLLGIAIRSKNPLPIDLPTLFWKLMVDEPLEPRDLIEVDYCEYESLLKLKELDQVTFENSIFESFTCVLSDGSTVELIPNGAQTPVTWDNRELFMRLKCERRLYESKVQIDAIKQGLCTLIPASALKAVAFYDFRLRACGSPFVDLDLLKRHTRYRGGVKESDPHIRFFWAVLESFSDQERRLFLRFAWGRERLPQEKDFLEDMKIFPNLRPNPDNQLPHAETCFFNVSLPKYTSEEVLRTRLLMAITSTQAMDGETHLAGQHDH